MFRGKRQYFKPPRSHLGFREETQNYAKRNRSQIFFLTCFVYRITSVTRFLGIVENIIQLISDNKGSVITRCLCALSIVCLLQETQRVQRLQNYKTIMLKISVVVPTCSKSLSFIIFCDLASSFFHFTANKRSDRRKACEVSQGSGQASGH